MCSLLEQSNAAFCLTESTAESGKTVKEREQIKHFEKVFLCIGKTVGPMGFFLL